MERSSKKERTRGSQPKGIGEDGQLVATAMSHPTRVRILMSMNTPRRRHSPKTFAREAGLSVTHCSYHFKVLSDVGAIVLVDTKPRRGATEHIYEPLSKALAWTAEWKNLEPHVKRAVLTSVLGGGIKALGSAIDNGTFEARDDSHLSWNTLEIDLQGWSEINAVLDNALKQLIRVEQRCLDRLEDGAKPILVSYFMSSFESPPKQDALVKTAGEMPPARTRATKDRRRVKRREARRQRDPQQVMAKVMQHATRVRILMSMNTPRRRLSPKMFANETGLPVHHCSYHFGELEDTGCIALVETRQRRGATEHIYEARQTALQWTEDWKKLGPAVKQSVLASVMRGAVEALASALEQGTFEAREDSHMSWSTIKVDEQGWKEVADIFDRALTALLDIDRCATARITRGADLFVASYFMGSFESPELDGL